MQLMAHRMPIVLAALLLAFAGAARGAESERVIVCLGDSLTEGYGLAPERAFPSLVERMLRERGQTVRVVNASSRSLFCFIRSTAICARL